MRLNLLDGFMGYASVKKIAVKNRTFETWKEQKKSRFIVFSWTYCSNLKMVLQLQAAAKFSSKRSVRISYCKRHISCFRMSFPVAKNPRIKKKFFYLSRFLLRKTTLVPVENVLSYSVLSRIKKDLESSLLTEAFLHRSKTKVSSVGEWESSDRFEDVMFCDSSQKSESREFFLERVGRSEFFRRSEFQLIRHADLNIRTL